MPRINPERLELIFKRTFWAYIAVCLFLLMPRCQCFGVQTVGNGMRQAKHHLPFRLCQRVSTDDASSPSSSPPPERSKRTNSLFIDKQPIQTVMAPMVAASDYAFRRLGRRYNIDLCFTQMLHARNVVNDASFRRSHLDFSKSDGEELPGLLLPQRNCIIGAEDYGLPPPRCIAEGEQGPLIVQLAGHDPATMVRAAHVLLDECSPGTIQGFDVNLGCPQGIARKGMYGAFLMEHDVDLVTEILSQLRHSMPSSVKISAKIRLPLSLRRSDLQERLFKLIHTAQIDVLTIHGRTLEENKTKTQRCRVELIRQAIDMAPDTFPVIANGGIETRRDATTILEDTGAAAAMSSEALLETPNLFEPSPDAVSARGLLNQQIQMAREYLSLAAEYPPLPGALGHVGGSFNIVRGHLFKILHRYVQEHVDLRERLASREFNNLGHAMKVIQEIEGRYAGLSDKQLLQDPSSDINATWYRRHWNVSHNIHTRTRGGAKQTSSDKIPLLSVEEQKKLVQERILILRKQRRERQGSLVPQTSPKRTAA